MPTADWEKSKRVAASIARGSIDRWVQEAPEYFNIKEVNAQVGAQRGLNRVDSQVLLFRDVLWMSYDTDLK